ncbi:MAG: Rieske 2Fe-2S domain-containing protein [Chloroflexi bacterium]|nr:Rieske 2Fe-2S domain-containing protein [Chloroflexota bacterium]
MTQQAIASPKEYQMFIKCYRGRADVVAQRQPDGSFKTVPGGFTYKRFLEQIEERNVYCLYNLNAEGAVGFILFDADLFPRPGPGARWDELIPKFRAKKEQVIGLMQALEKLGIRREQILVEFPSVGFHVVLAFEKPLPVQQVKAFARLARDQAGLTYELPFYPHEVCGYGDRVLLPLRRNENTGRRSNFVRDILSFDPATYNETPDFHPLARLQLIGPGVVEKAVEASNSQDYERVARVEELPLGTTKLALYRGERVLLVNQNGHYYALGELCPHACGPLSLGQLRDGEVNCVWHGARFRVNTGEVTAGPALTGLVHHPVVLKDGYVWLGPSQP